MSEQRMRVLMAVAANEFVAAALPMLTDLTDADATLAYLRAGDDEHVRLVQHRFVVALCAGYWNEDQGWDLGGDNDLAGFDTLEDALVVIAAHLDAADALSHCASPVYDLDEARVHEWGASTVARVTGTKPVEVK